MGRTSRPLTDSEKEQILNNKVKPGSSIDEYFIFVFNIFITIPLYVVIMIPTMIICQLIKMAKGKKRPRKPEYLEIKDVATDRKAPQDRQYDVIVYGATGFTGKLVAEYLANNYDSKLKWAIAGRSQSKLDQVKDFMSMGNPQVAELPIVIARSDNKQELIKMINNTRVLISTVGPFSRYGNDTVALCAQYGTHYIDSTGEVGWVREMIQRYDNVARKSGAQLISCCGLDCIPWDIVTYAVSKQMQEKHKQKLAKIECYDEMYQAMSGGTFSTLQTSFMDPLAKTKVSYDPLVKQLGKDEKSTYGFKSRTQKFLAYSSKIKSFIGMWGLADGNAGIIKRSNAILGYNENLRYFEAYIYTNFIHGFNDQIRLILLQSYLFAPPILALMNKIYFPQPGQGHTAHQMNQGYLKLKAYGVGEQGAKVKATFTLPDDPGYRDTARMLSEAALTLAYEQDHIKIGGGYITPACIGEPLLRRLVETGSTIKYE